MLGISSFGNDPSGVAGHLSPLLNHAREVIPPSLHSETQIYLLATAGMRLLPQDQRNVILEAACDFIKFHSHFRLDKPSPSGPCGSSVRIITGEEEGLFGWIAVNYLMDEFSQRERDRATYGFLDMGGASTQIAFEPSLEERRKTKNLSDVRLRLIGGEEISHQVFVTTWLGYGTNKARERYVGEIIAHQEKLRSHSSLDDHANHGPILDPCLPQDLSLHENSAYPGHDDPHSQRDHTLIGTGSFEECLKGVEPLLNKGAPCSHAPCPFGGVHVPHIDFSVSHFIGVSEYWYSSEHVFGLGGPYNFVQYERAASEFCQRDWNDILQQHRVSKQKGRLGGVGEVEKDGGVVDTGVWDDDVEISRLQMQCFKSAWLVNVLHEGIGLPRIVDRGGNATGDVPEIQDKVSQKGLGRPVMQSMDVIGDTAISWALGKMVLVASSEVPPLSSSALPLSDPVVNADEESKLPSPDDMNTDTSQGDWAPPASGWSSLSVSPVGAIFYLLCVTVAFVIAYRLRHHCQKAGRHFLRGATIRWNDADDLERLNMENGLQLNGSRFLPMSYSSFKPSSATSWASRPLHAMRSHLSRLLSTWRPSEATSPLPSAHMLRHMQGTSPRRTPHRSFSSPSLKYQNGAANTHHAGALYSVSTSIPPRSNTPPVSQYLNGLGSQSLYSLPRSRNSSQLNLSTLVPRQPLSRGGSSGQQTPTNASIHGE